MKFITIVKRIIFCLIREVKSIPLTLICFFCSFMPKKFIIVSAWCKNKSLLNLRQDNLVHNNWGDDINIYFLELMSRKKVFIYPNTRFSRIFKVNKYLFIGSVLTVYPLNNTIVVGSGVLNNKISFNIQGYPKDILFVRGPLSREILLKNGINCPMCYGDPALLLPKFYLPKSTRKFKIGLIPHYQDYKTDFISKINEEVSSHIVIIKMQGYEKWTTVIDQICSCDIIVSSSLHGLIVGESYNIPSYWAHFSDYIDGWNFKFYDFYYSINKRDVKPTYITNREQLWCLYDKKNEWKRGNINTDELYEMCKKIGFINE